MPDASALAITELEYFRGLESGGQNAALVEANTGCVLFEHVAAYEGVFLVGGLLGVEAGIGASEFFIRDRESKEDLFRATRFEQIFLDPNDSPGAYVGRVQLRDLDSGVSYTGHSGAT